MKSGSKSIVYLILAMLIAVGVYGIWHINKDEFPTFELKQGLVAAIFPGASAEEVEQQVAKPLEETLLSLSEVNRENLQITSSDGICYLLVDLNSPARKKDEVWSKIKLRLESAKSSLPPGVLAVVVIDDFSAVSSSLIALVSSDKEYGEMNYYAENLCERLRQIPELASAKIYGGRDEEIAVTTDLRRLSAYGVSSSSLLLGMQTSAVASPSGDIKTATSKTPIHIGSIVGSEEEVASHIVYSDPDGGIVRLGDIATIERRYADASSVVSHNGNIALIVSVEMRPENNIVAFGKELDRVIGEFSRTLPESVKISRITDQPKVVGTSVFSFLRDLVISMIVVILVMLMLFPMKSALIASSGVPVCTAVAIAVMYLTGIDLNTVTLAALIVVLGMIVDDSIITMDGYMGHLDEGLPREEAARKSTKELVVPMFMATLSISLMFFPMLGIITGYLGDFVQLFPWVVGIALMTSLFYAVFVVPTLETRFITSAHSERTTFLTRVQNVFFRGLQGIYDKAQDFCFRHAATTIIAGFAAIGLGLLMFSQLTVQMMPKADRDFFAVELSLEGNASLESTKVVADSLSRMMLSDERVKSVTSFVGSSAPRFTATYSPVTPAPNVAQMIVNTTSTKATTAILPEYERRFEHYFPEALVRIKQMDYQAVTPIEVRLFGEDRTLLGEVADSVKCFLGGLKDEVMWVHSTDDDCINGVEVTLEPEESVRLGVNKTLLSLQMAGAVNGTTLASLWEGDKSIPVRLYDSNFSQSGGDFSGIGDMMVATSIPGVSVPLRQVASIEPSWHDAHLTRYAARNAVVVSADMKFGKSQPVAMQKVQSYISSLDLPKGVEVEYGGLSSINSNVIPEIILSFICAVLVLFFFLLFHFKKISIAILTIVLSMLCLFGAFLGLYVFGLDFSITAVLGLISLVGIIVRNGIIMFEYAEQLRFEEGIPVREAAALAGKRRMRPIFLTSCTTALGVLPMIISGDLLWMPLGVVICFGTLLSVFLITLIMPVSYWQIFRKESSHEGKK